MAGMPRAGELRARTSAVYEGYERVAMRIVVDFDLCQSHGLCTEAAPELFEIRDDGFLYVLNETPGKELAGKLEKAVLECPTGAISIKDE
jgi:ferredoxin